MTAIDNAVKINGAKYRSFKKKSGNWSDPFKVHDFFSRTFAPEGTEVLEAQEEAEMIQKIKATTGIKFKEAELSTATKAILSREGISLTSVDIKKL